MEAHGDTAAPEHPVIASSEERILFLLGLVVLFVSGCVVLAINSCTDARRSQLSDNLSESLWGFTPSTTVDDRLRRQKWAYRKLIASGIMICALLLSLSVRALKPTRALLLSVGLSIIWTAGITIFWYYSILPGATKGDLPSGVKGNSEKMNADNNTGQQKDQRLPVTIVTGFLGAGKTTLVKHILSNTVGMKVLVIENEVGQQGIDHDLLLQYAGKEEIMLLKNGCVCCTVRSDLIKTFRAIFEKKAVLEALDWVVIETTGLADPAPVIQSLLIDELCKQHLRVDSVLTVVDSKHIMLHLPPPGEKSDKPNNALKEKNSSEAALQIAFADRVLLNKTDLVTDTELSGVREIVKSINPEADVLTCRNSEIDLQRILNIRSFDPEVFSKSILSTSQEVRISSTTSSSVGFSFLPTDSNGKVDLTKSKATWRNGSGLSVTPARLGASHSAGKDNVSTISMTLPESEPIDLDKFNAWILALLQRDGVDIYRFKGILNVDGYAEQFIMHGVHMIFNGERGKVWGDEKSRHSTIVFIGKNLNAAELNKHFRNCRVLKLHTTSSNEKKAQDNLNLKVKKKK